MKKSIGLLFLFLILFGCKAKIVAPTVVKLAPSEVDNALKMKAYELGNRILSSCNTSKFKQFSTNEATAEVIKNTTPEKISRTCQKFIWKYGAFKELKLIEVILDKTQKISIFRYKAIYEKTYVIKELRVTINNENKLSAIKSSDWKD